MKVFTKEILLKLVPVTQDFSGFSEVGEVWNDEKKEFDTFVAETLSYCKLKKAGTVSKKYIYAVIGSLPSQTFKEGDKINPKNIDHIKPIWK